MGYPDGTESPASWRVCERLQRVETLTLANLRNTSDSRLQAEDTCHNLNGYSLWLEADGCWTDMWGRRICGVTICGQKAIQVGSLPDGGVPESSALPHELVHALQNCDATFNGLFHGQEQHENWLDAGIYEQIGIINSKLVGTYP